MSRSRRLGTLWESAIVTFLKAMGAVHVERRALNGAKDRGDIAGIPGIVIEAKNAGRIELAKWMDEAEAERINDGADFGVVWAKKRGRASAGDGYVVMSGAAFTSLLRAAGYIPELRP